MKIGLSFAGGGIKGAAHIGVLKAFEEENIKIDYISGASSGSIIATLYAMGFNHKEILNIFKKYSEKIKYFEPRNIIKLIYGILIKRKIIIDGLNSGEIIEKIVNEIAHKKNIKKIKDIKMPLLIPSVDIHSGKVYFFCSKEKRIKYSDKIIYESNIEIGKAIRASCSYPLIFSPCKYKNTKLIDGGIRENIPWKGLKEIGADKVISIVFEKELSGNNFMNIVEVVGDSLDILSHELLNYEIIGTDYLLKIKTKNISLLDKTKIDELFNFGYKITKSKIKEIKNIIK